MKNLVIKNKSYEAKIFPGMKGLYIENVHVNVCKSNIYSV